MSQCCKTCAHLVVPAHPSGRRIVKKVAHKCGFPIQEMPALPDSITSAYGYKAPSENGKCYVWPDKGATCPTWVEYAKKVAA